MKYLLTGIGMFPLGMFLVAASAVLCFTINCLGLALCLGVVKPFRILQQPHYFSGNIILVKDLGASLPCGCGGQVRANRGGVFSARRAEIFF